LHDRGIAHRDIKPENLLFADKTKKTIKIADFGEAKTFYNNQLSTYCGTPDYMCPEIIKSEVYGKEVDMWALGVTTFVLLGIYCYLSISSFSFVRRLCAI
jgi:calcium/calmodulin-dependent protein kinase I